jgi:hypothetical protein
MTMISSPADRKKIKTMISEISDSYTRIAAERDLVKETIAEMSKEFELPKKTLNKMAKTYYKQSFLKEQQDQEDFELLYTNIVDNQAAAGN